MACQNCYQKYRNCNDVRRLFLNPRRRNLLTNFGSFPMNSLNGQAKLYTRHCFGAIWKAARSMYVWLQKRQGILANVRQFRALRAARSAYRMVQGWSIEVVYARQNAAKRAQLHASRRWQEWANAHATLAEMMPLAKEELFYLFQSNLPKGHPTGKRKLAEEFIAKRQAEEDKRQQWKTGQEVADDLRRHWEAAKQQYEADSQAEMVAVYGLL